MRGVGIGSRSCPGKERMRHGWDGWVDRGSDAWNGGDLKGFSSELQ